MAHYIIVKRTKEELREYGTTDAYRGPTCRSAQVEPACVYSDFDLAEEDALKLSQHNHAGFLVVEIDSRVVSTYHRGERYD